MSEELKDGREYMEDRQTALNTLHQGLFGISPDALTPPVGADVPLHEAALAWVGTERFRHIFRDRLGLWPFDKWVCTDFNGRDGVFRMWVNLHDGYVSYGALISNWERGEVDFMVSCLSPGDCILDIGANIGIFSVQAAAAVGPQGVVHSFEPSGTIARMLQRTIYENGLMDRCVIHNYGLGDQEIEGRYHRSAHSTNPGASFISQGEQGGPGEPISVRPLDSIPFDRRVTFIKMDVEGFEYNIVRGARNMLAHHRPVVMSEFFPRSLRVIGGASGAAYIAEWESLGYQIYLLDNGVQGQELISDAVSIYDNLNEPLNIVCRPREAAVSPPPTNRLKQALTGFLKRTPSST